MYLHSLCRQYAGLTCKIFEMSRSAPKKRCGRESWKDRLKAQCLERVRQQRAQILSAMRHRHVGGAMTMAAAGAQVASTLNAIIAESSSAAASETAVDSSETTSMYSAHGRTSATAAVDEDFEMMMEDDCAPTASDVGGIGARQSAQLGGGLESLTAAEHAELVSSMERALQEELQHEEQLVLEQYETMWADDEANMQAQLETAMAAHFAQIDHQATMLASTSPSQPVSPLAAASVAAAAGAGGAEQVEQTLCPICKRNWLLTADGGRVILCNCGFRLDVKNDAVTLLSLRQQLAAVYQSHRSRCSCEPTFSLKERFGISNLWAECPTCGLCEVVI